MLLFRKFLSLQFQIIFLHLFHIRLHIKPSFIRLLLLPQFTKHQHSYHITSHHTHTVTRILTSIGQLGFAEYRKPFLTALRRLCATELRCAQQSYDLFWSKTVVYDDDFVLRTGERPEDRTECELLRLERESGRELSRAEAEELCKSTDEEMNKKANDKVNEETKKETNENVNEELDNEPKNTKRRNRRNRRNKKLNRTDHQVNRKDNADD